MRHSLVQENAVRLPLCARSIMLLSAAVIGILATPAIVWADDMTSAAQAPGSASSPQSTQNAPATQKPLKGSVEKVELNLELLRDVGLDLKEVLKAASSLYDEVTVQPVRLLTQPEVVGNGIIINVPIGTTPVGPPQPARKERVDLAMNSIKPIIKMMKANVDAFVAGDRKFDLPADVIAQLKPKFKEWASTVNTVASREQELEAITASPPYSNRTIADLAVSLQKDVKELDKTRRAIYRVIRKEGKRIAAGES